MSLDYERFGRQIAVPEIGREGQTRLAAASLTAPRSVGALARDLWRRAGGGDDCTELDAPVVEGASVELGIAAWSCVESARAALGAKERRALPTELVARLNAGR